MRAEAKTKNVDGDLFSSITVRGIEYYGIRTCKIGNHYKTEVFNVSRVLREKSRCIESKTKKEAVIVHNKLVEIYKDSAEAIYVTKQAYEKRLAEITTFYDEKEINI